MNYKNDRFSLVQPIFNLIIILHTRITLRLNKNRFIVFSIIFLLTGFFNNSFAIENYLNNDTLINQKKDNVIEYNIIRNCKDSIIQDIENKKIYLYGDASIEYGKIKITAGKIVIDWKNNTILAIGTKDSSV